MRVQVVASVEEIDKHSGVVSDVNTGQEEEHFEDSGLE
jgi:hypothetical protein